MGVARWPRGEAMGDAISRCVIHSVKTVSFAARSVGTVSRFQAASARAMQDEPHHRTQRNALSAVIVFASRDDEHSVQEV